MNDREATARDPVDEMLHEMRAACEYSDGTDGEETGVDSLIDYKDALEVKLAEVAAKLLDIRRNLHPENHVGFWQTQEMTHPWLDSADEEFLRDPDPYEWTSQEIEWVSLEISRALEVLGLPLDEPYVPRDTISKLVGKHKFDNGFGASIIDTGLGRSEGLLELAVLAFNAKGHDRIVYDTPITNYVIGHLSEDEAQALLDKIAALPAR